MATTSKIPGGIALLLVLVAAPCRAYDPITWSTIDGGGVARVIAGAYTLGGTIGQHDAGTLTGGTYTLGGGFWGGGTTNVSGVPDLQVAPPPIAFRFFPSTPNPFHSQSRLAFDLPAPAEARLHVYDVAGRLVRNLEFGPLPAGHHEQTWSAADDAGHTLSNGVYFLRFEAGAAHAGQKVVVLR